MAWLPWGGIDTAAELAAEGAVESLGQVRETEDEGEMQREMAELEVIATRTPSADGPRSLAKVFDRISAEVCKNVGNVHYATIWPNNELLS